MTRKNNLGETLLPPHREFIHLATAEQPQGCPLIHTTALLYKRRIRVCGKGSRAVASALNYNDTHSIMKIIPPAKTMRRPNDPVT